MIEKQYNDYVSQLKRAIDPNSEDNNSDEEGEPQDSSQIVDQIMQNNGQKIDDQADRDDDAELDADTTPSKQGQINSAKNRNINRKESDLFSNAKGLIEKEVSDEFNDLDDDEEEKNEPFNLADLRVSMIPKNDDLKDSTTLME